MSDLFRTRRVAGAAADRDLAQSSHARRDADPRQGQKGPVWPTAVDRPPQGAQDGRAVVPGAQGGRDPLVRPPASHFIKSARTDDSGTGRANPIPSVNIKVICGEADGSESQGVVSSPVRPLGGCWFADVVFNEEGGTIFHRVPTGWNSFVRPPLRSALPSPTDEQLGGRCTRSPARSYSGPRARRAPSRSFTQPS